jgi:hypothetical protein
MLEKYLNFIFSTFQKGGAKFLTFFLKVERVDKKTRRPLAPPLKKVD